MTRLCHRPQQTAIAHHFLPITVSITVAAMLIYSTNASAATFSYGSINGAFDSSFSYGAQWRLDSRNPGLISKANGGTRGDSYTNLLTGGTGDGSSNTDDGNLNYDRGLLSSAFKGTHELSLSWANYGLFLRGTYFYDKENNDEKRDRRAETTSLSNNARLSGLYSGLQLLNSATPGLDTSTFPAATLNSNDQYTLSKDAKEAVGKDAKLLDAYVSASFDFGVHPLDLRLGRQVVSWGESTFIQNGINSINPVDIPAIRLPGAELREALLPISLIWASYGLSENITLEAFYQLDWQKTQVDEPGTYFSTNDFIGDGGQFVTISGLDECTDNLYACTTPNTISRAATHEADDTGQYGLALRWFAESLNSTEFGFYAMNYHSRRPLISATAGQFDDNTFINTLLNNANTLATQLVTLGLASNTSTALQTALTPALFTAINNSLESGGQYFTEYPEDIKLYGVSFNSSIDRAGIALSGEISFRPEAPVQIDDQELLQASLSSIDPLVQAAGNIAQLDPTLIQPALFGPQSQYNSAIASVSEGDYLPGYIKKEVTQAQITAVKLFGPRLGASQWALVGEAGFTHVNLPEKSVLLIDALGASDDGQRTTQTGFGDDFSWGYRLRARFDYHNLFDAWNMTTTYSFAHDVNGNTPIPIANFVEDRKAFELGIDFDRQSTYGIEFTYASFWGAGERNLISDRDFASVTFRYAL
ncbi:MAG: DUF1302 domain-containing protein [Gammaproteobacteria bacterium]